MRYSNIQRFWYHLIKSVRLFYYTLLNLGKSILFLFYGIYKIKFLRNILIIGGLMYGFIRYMNIMGIPSTYLFYAGIFGVILLGLIGIQWASNKDRDRVDREYDRWFPRRDRVNVNVEKRPQLRGYSRDDLFNHNKQRKKWFR